MPHALVNTPHPLRLQMADGNTSVYPRAYVYTSAGALHTTLNLTHISDGLFGVSYTFTTEDEYSAVFKIFDDAGYTVLSPYDREAEDIEVTKTLPNELWNALVDDHLIFNSLGEAIAIIRGLVQNNFVLDNTAYNVKGLLTGARIRVFKSNADATSETSPIATFTVAGTSEIAPNDHLGQKMKVTRDP